MADSPAPRIILAGASGFIGRALTAGLSARGYHVTALGRGEGANSWNPATGRLDPQILSGAAAIICLSGASLIGQPWTKKYRHTLISSRVDSVNTLVNAMGRLNPADRPGAFICSSAVGYYGADCADELLTEAHPPGSDFLADLCQQWEQAAAQAAHQHGVRTVQVRTGLVMAAHGGMLKQMLPAYRLGLGVQLGDGNQWMPLIALKDAVRAFIHIIEHPELSGAINMCAPHPVRHGDFNRQLAAAVRRPALFTAPSWLLSGIGGEFAQQTLLASQRAIPKALSDSGFRFLFPDASAIIDHSMSGASTRGTSTRNAR